MHWKYQKTKNCPNLHNYHRFLHNTLLISTRFKGFLYIGHMNHYIRCTLYVYNSLIYPLIRSIVGSNKHLQMDWFWFFGGWKSITWYVVGSVLCTASLSTVFGENDSLISIGWIIPRMFEKKNGRYSPYLSMQFKFSLVIWSRSFNPRHTRFNPIKHIPIKSNVK